MPVYEIKFKPAQLREIERRLATMPKKIPRILTDAVKRTAKQAESLIVKAMAAKVTLTQAKIRKKIRLYLPVGNHRAPHARIKILPQRFPLGDFQARKTKKGASYKIDRTGPRVLWRYDPAKPAFFLKLKTGHKGIFSRDPGTRTPISEVKGPSIMGIFTHSRAVVRSILKQTNRKMLHNIDGQIRRHLEKK